jgi:hypothetical protein
MLKGLGPTLLIDMSTDWWSDVSQVADTGCTDITAPRVSCLRKSSFQINLLISSGNFGKSGNVLGDWKKRSWFGSGSSIVKAITQLGFGRLQFYENASLLSHISYCSRLRIHGGKNILILSPSVMTLFMLSFAILTDIAKIAEGEPLIQVRWFEEVGSFSFAVAG